MTHISDQLVGLVEIALLLAPVWIALLLLFLAGWLALHLWRRKPRG